MKNSNFLLKFLVWRIKNVSTRNFVLILSAIIGLIAGLAAVILKASVHFIQHLLTGGFDVAYANYFYLGYPLLGLVITVMIAKYIEKNPLVMVSQVFFSTLPRNPALSGSTKKSN